MTNQSFSNVLPHSTRDAAVVPDRGWIPDPLDRSGFDLSTAPDRIDVRFQETGANGLISSTVNFAPGLFGDSATENNIPFVEIDHMGGCCCIGCGGMPDESSFFPPNDGTQAADDVLVGGPLSAPAQLSDMADFLGTNFWTNFGTSPREFNLTGAGANAKSGVLHYNVTGFSSAGRAGTDTNGLTAARADLVRDTFDLYGEVLGISFVETTSSNTGFTDFFFKDTDAGRAYANSTGSSGNIQYSWINVSQDWSGGTSTYNDYTLQTIFHEIGHALGLGHQGLYNGTGSYPSDADFENDSWQATMMSYFSQNENTTIPASFAFLQTPMAVDWIALQDMYGDQSFNGTNFGVGNAFLGNTIYGFNTNITASVSDIWAQFASFADRTASTIVDAGGIDTLDFSGYSASQLINLTPTSQFSSAPSLSNIGGRTGNLALAEGTIIENAIGGSGNDTFFGNLSANILTGNAGNDLFNDSAGADTYLGGSGTDAVDFGGLFSSYAFSISGVFMAVINAATDLVENTVEFLRFDDQTWRFQDIVEGLDTNSAPVANGDSYVTDEDAALSGGNLLANDTDADGDVLTIASVNGATSTVGNQITLASGAQLTVNANGTFTYDPNGAFTDLNAGQTATDSFSYTAQDGSAVSDAATVTITLNGVDEPSTGTVIGQSGVATVSQSGPNQWHSVSFAATVEDAVVVMGPATGFDDAPLTTRVRNTTDTGFEFQIDEWDYLDGVHGTESIGWFAVSEGSHRLASGETIVAGIASVGTGFSAISFGETLTDAVVLTEVSSVVESDAVTTRIRNVTDQGFRAQIEEQEAGGSHPAETVSWIAIEAGQNADFEAFVTPDEVRNTVSSYNFVSTFGAVPVLLADMQTTDGGDTATVRLETLDAGGVSLFIEEEQSANVETAHTNEEVGVVALRGGLLFTQAQPNTAPVSQDDTATVSEGALLSIDVLANDADADGDTLSLSRIEGQAIGVGQTISLVSGARVTLNADQSIAYDQNSVFDALALGQTATEVFAYSVVDTQGATSGANVTVTITGLPSPQPSDAIGQSGVVSVEQSSSEQWHSVFFDAAIEDAVVVLGPVTINGDDALSTRVRNVTDTGFEFQLDEWDYLDGAHGAEDIGWLAIAQGSHILSTGQTIVASTETVGVNFETLAFGQSLEDAIVFAEVTSVNESSAVTTRIRNVTDQGFDAQIEEEEAGGAHRPETVSWIAIESGTGTGLDVARTGGPVDDSADSFVFNQTFTGAPVVIADMQTTNGADTATLRLTDLDANGLSLFVQEEQSADAELDHISEAAGYVALEEGLIYLDTFLV